jgi:hypothetical protein
LRLIIAFNDDGPDIVVPTKGLQVIHGRREGLAPASETVAVKHDDADTRLDAEGRDIVFYGRVHEVMPARVIHGVVALEITVGIGCQTRIVIRIVIGVIVVTVRIVIGVVVVVASTGWYHLDAGSLVIHVSVKTVHIGVIRH